MIVYSALFLFIHVIDATLKHDCFSQPEGADHARYVDDVCYILMDDTAGRMTRTDAIDYCKTRSIAGITGRLMVLANANQRVAVVAELQLAFLPSNYETHIALFQTNTTNEPAGGWFWQDTTTMVALAPMRVNDATGVFVRNGALFWRTGEPNNAGNIGDDCATMYPQANMMDTKSGNVRSLMCEFVQPFRRGDYAIAQDRPGMTTISTLQVANGVTSHECAALCSSNLLCSSFSYHMTDGYCATTEFTSNDGLTLFTALAGAQFFDRI